MSVSVKYFTFSSAFGAAVGVFISTPVDVYDHRGGVVPDAGAIHSSIIGAPVMVPGAVVSVVVCMPVVVIAIVIVIVVRAPGAPPAWVITPAP